jgi:hypothetical protein
MKWETSWFAWRVGKIGISNLLELGFDLLFEKFTHQLWLFESKFNCVFGLILSLWRLRLLLWDDIIVVVVKVGIALVFRNLFYAFEKELSIPKLRRWWWACGGCEGGGKAVCKERGRDLCELCCEGDCANYIRAINVWFWIWSNMSGKQGYSLETFFFSTMLIIIISPRASKKFFFFRLTRVNPSDPWPDYYTGSTTRSGLKTMIQTGKKKRLQNGICFSFF